MVKFRSSDDDESPERRTSRSGRELRKRDPRLNMKIDEEDVEDEDETESRRSSGSKSTKEVPRTNGVSTRYTRGSSSSMSNATATPPEESKDGRQDMRNGETSAAGVIGRTRRSTRQTEKELDIKEENGSSVGGSVSGRITRSRLSTEGKEEVDTAFRRPTSALSNHKQEKEQREGRLGESSKAAESSDSNNEEDNGDSSSAEDEDYREEALGVSRNHEQDSYDSNDESLFVEAKLRRSRRHRKQMYDTYEESWIIGGGPEAKGYPSRRSSRLSKESKSGFRVNGNWEGDDNGTSMNEESDDMYSRVKRRRTARAGTGRLKGRFKKSSKETQHTNEERSPINTNQRHQPDNEEPVSRRLRDRNKLTMSSESSRPFRQSQDDLFRNRLRRKKRKRRASSSSSNSSSSSSDSSALERSPSKRRSRKRALAGSGFNNAGQGNRNLSKREMLMLMEVQPIAVDPTITFQSVGGLDQFIGKLKEIVLFPLMYGEFYSMQGMRPPRGVLLHGPPGTGKTLLARALANECCSINGKKVTFFLRKGADLLNKWIGESERQLRLLFQQAARQQPSIIFFDEIDGLAPVRSAKSDQVHNSIVSTLLAELDGLQDRGQVIVVGSTNRLDFIDPALRRPGRFDCELPIFLPTRDGRKQILDVHVSKWKDIPSVELVNEIADRSIGFSGADLKLLCWNASMNALRRTYPQIYGSNLKYQLEYDSIKLDMDDWELAMKSVSPSTSRSLFSKYSPSQPLPLHIKSLLQHNFETVLKVTSEMFPYKSLGLVTEESVKRLAIRTDPDSGLDTYIVPALLHTMEGLPVHVLSYEALHMDGVAAEFSVTQICAEILKQCGPSIVYIPRIDRLMTFLSNDSKEIIIRMINQSVKKPALILATIQETTYNLIEHENQELMNLFHGCFLTLHSPLTKEVVSFFEPVFQQALNVKKKKVEIVDLPQLQLAPPESPVKKQLDPDEKRAIEKRETTVFRELRIFLREVLSKIARNKKFNEFTKPVDGNEVPDYLDVIPHPMDLETMMCKVNSGQYLNGNQFLEDIKLISTNCLNYNPHKTDSDKRLRLRAFELHDFATKLIEEMDSDFEEQCNEIIKARSERNAPVVEVPLIIEPETDQNRPLSNNTPDNSVPVPSTSKPSGSAITPEEQASSSTSALKKKPSNSTPTINGINGSGKSSVRRRKKSSWANGNDNSNRKKRKLVTNFQVESKNDSQTDSVQSSQSQEIVIVADSSSQSLSLSPALAQGEVVQISSETVSVVVQRCDEKAEVVSAVVVGIPETDEKMEEEEKVPEVHLPETLSQTAEEFKEEFAELLEDTVTACEKFTLIKLLDMRFHILRLVEKHQYSAHKGNLAQDIRSLLNTAKEKSSRLSALQERLT